MEMNVLAAITTLIVHAGIFHSDDVFCGALLKYLLPDINIIRTNVITEEMKNDPSVIICDVGCGKYDHHQADAALRKDGRKHAACGLLFDEIGHLIFNDSVGLEYFKKSYIIPVEDQDNGYVRNPLSMAIKAMNPSYGGSKKPNEAYMDAVDFVLEVIRNEASRANGIAKMKYSIDSSTIYFNNGVRVLRHFMPADVFIGSNTLFTISKSNRGGYNLSAVKISEDSMRNVQDLPSSWLTNKPTGCTFVHPALFLAAFETEEAALNAILKEV